LTVKDRSLVDRLWELLCSLRLTLFVLIVLALTSIIGTIIPQGQPEAAYLSFYSEKVYRLFKALDLIDMYRSWWFVGLLALMTLNLIACTINRFPRSWRLVRRPQRLADESLLRALSLREEFVSRRSPDELRSALVAVVQRRFRRPDLSESGDRFCLFAQKGALSRFGAYLVHASIIVILLGAIIGMYWGIKGVANIPEGAATSVALSRTTGAEVPLGFTVRCDDFSVSYYDDNRTPREFKSHLTILENGQPVAGYTKVPVVVNSPLHYKGWTFYQASYGVAGEPDFVFRVQARAGGEEKEIRAPFNRPVPLPDGKGFFRIFRAPPSMQRFGNGVAVQVVRKGQPPRTPFMVFQGNPDFDAKRNGDYIFNLVSQHQPMYTGLEVAKDPGVPLIWLGSALMVLGCCVAFFLSHRRLWVLVAPLEDGRTGITMGGTAHRNQAGFELFFDELKKDIRAALEGSGGIA